MPYAVQLDYFKRSGRWHSEGAYVTQHTSIVKIWDEVRLKRENWELPGLVPTAGQSEYIVSVDVPDHPHRHPHLII